MDNVQIDWGVDRSTFCLAGHADRSHYFDCIEKKSCSVFSVVIGQKQVAVYCRTLIWNPRWNATRTTVYNSLHGCNVFLLLTIRHSAISSKQQLVWILYNPRFKSYLSYKFDQPEMIRDQAKMNLAGQRVRRLPRNYFEPCNYAFNYYALNDKYNKCIYI